MLTLRLAASVAALALLVSSPTARAAPAANVIGFNVHLPANDVLDAVKASGSRLIRIDFNWYLAQPQQGKAPDFSLFDRVVNAARARGLEVFATVGYGPAWASAGGSDANPNNDAPKPGLYQAFCKAAATHFKGRIQYWGLWNEPNLDFFEGTRQQWIDNVVIEGIRGFKAGCPSCKVLGPELASIGNEHDVWLDASIKALKKVGLMYDIITWHNYSAFKATKPGWACWSGDLFVHDLDEVRSCLGVPVGRKPVRQVLLDNGLGSLKVWITETGYKAPSGDKAAEALQVTYYRRVLEEQLARSWWTHTFFYEIVDDNNIADKWGVALRNGPPYPGGYVLKPVFGFLQGVHKARAFGGTVAACADGLDNDRDGKIDSADPGCSGAADDDERDGVAPGKDAGAGQNDAGADASVGQGDAAPASPDGSKGNEDAGGANGNADAAAPPKDASPSGGSSSSSGCAMWSHTTHRGIAAAPYKGLAIALFLLVLGGYRRRRRRAAARQKVETAADKHPLSW